MGGARKTVRWGARFFCWGADNAGGCFQAAILGFGKRILCLLIKSNSQLFILTSYLNDKFLIWIFFH